LFFPFLISRDGEFVFDSTVCGSSLATFEARLFIRFGRSPFGFLNPALSEISSTRFGLARQRRVWRNVARATRTKIPSQNTSLGHFDIATFLPQREPGAVSFVFIAEMTSEKFERALSIAGLLMFTA
jgi:hypothetical protein